MFVGSTGVTLLRVAPALTRQVRAAVSCQCWPSCHIPESYFLCRKTSIFTEIPRNIEPAGISVPTRASSTSSLFMTFPPNAPFQSASTAEDIQPAFLLLDTRVYIPGLLGGRLPLGGLGPDLHGTADLLRNQTPRTFKHDLQTCCSRSRSAR